MEDLRVGRSSMLRNAGRVLGASLVLALVASPAAASSSRADVESFVRAYLDASYRMDVDAVMKMVSTEPEPTSVTMGHVVTGWESIRSGLTELVGSETTIRRTLGRMHVTLLRGAHAVVVAPFTIDTNVNDEAVDARGIVTLVLDKSSGEWKLVHEHSSFELPTSE